MKMSIEQMCYVIFINYVACSDGGVLSNHFNIDYSMGLAYLIMQYYIRFETRHTNPDGQFAFSYIYVCKFIVHERNIHSNPSQIPSLVPCTFLFCPTVDLTVEVHMIVNPFFFLNGLFPPNRIFQCAGDIYVKKSWLRFWSIY